MFLGGDIGNDGGIPGSFFVPNVGYSRGAHRVPFRSSFAILVPERRAVALPAGSLHVGIRVVLERVR